MNRWHCILVGILLLAGTSGSAPAQDRHWSDDAWHPIVEENGVAFAYLFYSEADNYNNGVVVRLHNRNDHPTRYEFRIVFRSTDDEHVEEVHGTLDPGELKTGDDAGLFWVPFPDGQAIGEVGLRGYRVERVDPSER